MDEHRGHTLERTVTRSEPRQKLVRTLTVQDTSSQRTAAPPPDQRDAGVEAESIPVGGVSDEELRGVPMILPSALVGVGMVKGVALRRRTEHDAGRAHKPELDHCPEDESVLTVQHPALPLGPQEAAPKTKNSK